jgi:PAS domain S-box-containing protein
MSEKDLNRRLEGLFSDLNDPRNAVEPPDLAAAAGESPETEEQEAALRESEHKFRTLYERTSDAVMLLDERSFFDCNPATLKVFGCATEEQFIGRHFSQFSPPLQPDGQDSLSLSQQRIATALQEGSYRFEWLHCRLDGSEFPAEVWLTSMDIGGKKVLQAVVRNITERKRSEEAARESQQMLQLVMNNIPQSIFWKDRNLTYLGCNRNFADDAGLAAPEEVIGKNDYDMPWVEQAELYRADDSRVMESGEPVLGYEEPQTTPDGSRIWLRTSKVPLRDAAGNVVAVLGMYEDITDRKRAEQQIRTFQAMAENSVDAIVMADSEGRISYGNRAFYELLGFDYEKSELIGESLASFTPEDQLAAQQEVVSQAIAVGGWRGEGRQRRKDGSLFDSALTVFPVRGEAGQLLGIAAITRDITERKRLEQQIQVSLERRRQQVEISTQVAQEIAAAPGLDELFRRVVTLIKERFGYYHAQIFRYEPNLEAVVLVSGYGEAGRKMLARRHRLGMGRGVVGTAAATGQPVLASDVTQDKDWTPNPDLPETKAELAVPIKLRDQVLGILDVQSEQPGALTEDDQLLLEGLCGQIAIAIEDTRLRQEMGERLDELDSMYRTMSREGWETFRKAAGQSLPGGYLFDRVTTRPVDDLWTPEMKSAVEQDALVPPAFRAEPSTGAPASAAVAPLSVRGEMVGVLGVIDDPKQPLSQDDLALVESVSEQVALALESARLFQQTQTALSESENLYQISAGLNAARTYDDILTALRTHTVMGETNQNGIFLFNSSWEDAIPERVSMLAGWGGSEETIALLRHFYLRDLPVAEILRRDEPVWTEDILKDDRFNAAARALYESLDMRSVFFVPLVTESRWIGFLSGGWQNPTSIDPASLRLLMAMAAQAAVAVQNMQRLQEIQIRAQREQALREIAAAINASENPWDSMPIVDSHVRKLIPIAFTALATYTPGEQEYTIYMTGDEMKTDDAGHGIRVPLEGSGAGWVIAHAEPWLDADLRSRKSFAEDDLLLSQGIVSRIILPLQSGERVVGAYVLSSQVVGAFTEEVVPVVKQIADQMALVLERTRLMAETRAALAETEAVYRRYLAKEWESFLGGAGGRAAAYVDSPAGLAAVSELSMPEIEQVIASGEPVVLNEAGNGEDQPTSRAAMAMPIRLRGQTIGVLDFYQEGQDWTWTDEERALVETLADQAALALENARLFSETRESAQRMQTLYETSRALSSALEQGAVLRTVLEAINRASGCDYLTVSLVDEQAGIIEIRHGIQQDQYDVFPEWVDQSGYSLNDPNILADVYRSGHTEVVDKWDARFEREAWRKFGLERLLRVYMPIKIRDRVLGVIEVGYDKQHKEQIGEAEIQTLTAFVDQAAVALENANLLQQAQRRAWRERLAREIAGKIQAAPDVETILQTAVRELSQVLGASQAMVRIQAAPAESPSNSAGNGERAGA